jgi:hypothetical protein
VADAVIKAHIDVVNLEQVKAAVKASKVSDEQEKQVFDMLQSLTTIVRQKFIGLS